MTGAIILGIVLITQMFCDSGYLYAQVLDKNIASDDATKIVHSVGSIMSTLSWFTKSGASDDRVRSIPVIQVRTTIGGLAFDRTPCIEQSPILNACPWDVESNVVAVNADDDDKLDRGMSP